MPAYPEGRAAKAYAQERQEWDLWKGEEWKRISALFQPSYPHRRCSGTFTYGRLMGGGFLVTLPGFSPSSKM